VSVWEPAAAEVTRFRTDSGDGVRPGESVTVAVTVRNDAGWPGERDVRVTAADQSAADRNSADRTVAQQTVRLDAESERTVTATVTFDQPGPTDWGGRQQRHVADGDRRRRARTGSGHGPATRHARRGRRPGRGARRGAAGEAALRERLAR